MFAQYNTANLSSPGESFALTDLLGSVRAIQPIDHTTDEWSAPFADAPVFAEYDAWGNTVWKDAQVRPEATIANGQTTDWTGRDSLFSWTGREYDPISGLQWNRARWYDPQVGRWLSDDPIGFAAGDTNLQRYVGNNPTNYVDPSGLDETPSAASGRVAEQAILEAEKRKNKAVEGQTKVIRVNPDGSTFKGKADISRPGSKKTEIIEIGAGTASGASSKLKQASSIDPPKKTTIMVILHDGWDRLPRKGDMIRYVELTIDQLKDLRDRIRGYRVGADGKKIKLPDSEFIGRCRNAIFDAAAKVAGRTKTARVSETAEKRLGRIFGKGGKPSGKAGKSSGSKGSRSAGLMLALGGMLFGTGVAVADGAKADSALRETVGDLMIYGFDPILGNLGGSLGTDDELPSPQEKAQQVREILEYLESLIGPESNEMQGFKHGDGPDRFPIRPAGPDVPLY